MPIEISRRAALAAVAAVALCAAPAALGAPAGAAFTTDPTGTAVNQNHFAAPDDVHLNGGPSCGAPAHAAALPDGDYAFRVTTPNGKTTLSSAPLVQRTFTVSGGLVVGATAEARPSACPGGGLVVRVGPFATSRNGVYKLWIVPASAPGYAGFPAKASKTDNFMIDGSGGPGGEYRPPPGGEF